MSLARRPWILPAALILVPVIGGLFILQPALAVLVVAVVLALRAVDAPLTVLCLFATAHMATPAYVRVPLPGGFYNPPISTGLMLMLFGIGLLRFLAHRGLPPVGPDVRRVLALFAIFAGVALLSLVDPRTTGEGVSMWVKVFLFPGLVVVAILAVATGPAEVTRIYSFLLAGAVIASVYGTVEHLIGFNPLIDRFESDILYFKSEILGDISYRAFSVYGNPIEFGTCVGMVIPFAMVRLATATDLRARLIYGAAMGLCLLGVAVTFSRGPLLAVMIGMVMIGLIYASFRRWLIGAAIAAAVVVITVWPFIQAGVMNRLRDVDNVTLRFKLWETAAGIFQDNPITGVGIGNFPQYYLEAARDHRIGPFLEFGEASVENIRVAENTYLQLAAETGLVGVAAAALFVGAMLWLTFGLATRAREPVVRDLAVACGTGMVIYAVNGMFITAYTHFFATMLLFGFLFGFVLALKAHVFRSETLQATQ
jgi:O-antigen ligase